VEKAEELEEEEDGMPTLCAGGDAAKELTAGEMRAQGE
jgi:hypothetical protein